MAFNPFPGAHISGLVNPELADGGNPLIESNTCLQIGMTAAWITANMSASQGCIIIPCDQAGSSLLDSEAGENDPTAAGDIRKVCYSLSEMMFDLYDAMATADRPAKMTLSRSGLIAGTGSQVSRTFTFTFVLDGSGLDVVAE